MKRRRWTAYLFRKTTLIGVAFRSFRGAGQWERGQRWIARLERRYQAQAMVSHE